MSGNQIRFLDQVPVGSFESTQQFSNNPTSSIDTGSLLITGSFSNPILTLVKGDNTTFPLNLSTLVPTSSSYAYTASYSLSSSYANSSSQTISSSYSTTSSYVINAISASYINLAQSASYASTSSYSISSSYASTSSVSISSSYANTSSYFIETDPIFNAKSSSLATTGSNIFIGNQTITGSLFITDSANITGGITSSYTGSLTGSLFGTSSYTLQALSASFATTSSIAFQVSASISTQNLQHNVLFIDTSGPGYIQVDGGLRYNPNQDLLTTTSSYAILAQTASYVVLAQTASYILNVVSSSYANTSSFVNPLKQNVQITGSLSISGSLNIISSSYDAINNWLGINTTPSYSLDVYRAASATNLRAANIVMATGTPAATNYALYVDNQGTTAVTNYGVWGRAIASNAAGGIAVGVYGQGGSSGTSGNSVYGGYFAGVVLSARTGYGVFTTVGNSGGGTSTLMYGIYAETTHLATTTKVIAANINVGSSTNAHYAFDAQQQGTSKWSVRATGQMCVGTSSAPVSWVNIAANTTAIPHISLIPSAGVTVASPANGDIWFDGTNLKIQIGGVTKTFTVT